jgi:hypothetical protein
MRRAAWLCAAVGSEELRSHALYPVANTVRAEGTSVVTPLGTLQTVLYTQTLVASR